MQAAQRALRCAEHHWTHCSPVDVADAMASATQAATQAQAGRGRAMKVAMQLNLAVAMHQGSDGKALA